MDRNIKYAFSARIWQHAGQGGWYFVSLPAAMAHEIRENLKWQEAGWGGLKARAKTGNSEWETAIGFDTKANTYLLPLKADIRKREQLETGKEVKVIVWV